MLNKKRIGFTLIETTIVISIIAMIVFLSVTVYWEGVVSSSKETVKARLQMEGRSLTERVVSNVRMASKVESNYDSYATGTDVLILALPAVDESGNFIYSSGNKVFDRVIYYLEGNNLHKLVKSTEASSTLFIQNNLDSILANNVSGLTFAYDAAELELAREVTMNISLQTVDKKQTITIPISAKGVLRNV